MMMMRLHFGRPSQVQGPPPPGTKMQPHHHHHQHHHPATPIPTSELPPNYSKPDSPMPQQPSRDQPPPLVPVTPVQHRANPAALCCPEQAAAESPQNYKTLPPQQQPNMAAIGTNGVPSPTAQDSNPPPLERMANSYAT